MKLALCLLTWNEIDGCRHDVGRLPRQAFDQLYAVDNHSTDGTVEYLQGQGITVYPQDHASYNGAYLSAFEHCRADALVLFHPKGSIDPAETLKFRPFFEAGYDLVVASRMIVGAVNEEDCRLWRPRKSFVKALAVATAVAWRREGAMVWDVLHGFRGMTRGAFFAMSPRELGVTIDLECVARSYRLGTRRVEFPVVERPRLAGGTHFKAWPTGRQMLRYLCWELRRELTKPTTR